MAHILPDSDLEKRVAALEAALAPSRYMPVTQEPTEAELADIRRDFEAALARPLQIIPQPPPLTPDEIRQLLRECVTVVKPGEHLILRVPWTTTPTQIRELQKALTGIAEHMDLPFKTLVVPGDELGAAEP